MLEDEERSRIDRLTSELATAPHVDHMALSKKARAERMTALHRVFDEGITWGEATGAHPILIQPEETFRAELRSINNNLVAQINVIEHYLPKWFSAGEFPPPYYAMRVAIILRKAKEHERERNFLATYLKNFRSRYGGSRSDEQLIERAVKLGVHLPPVR